MRQKYTEHLDEMLRGKSCLCDLKICFCKFFSNSFNVLVLIVHFKDKNKTRTNR